MDEREQGDQTSYAVLNWRMEDGLPLNKVRALAQTPDGYLWVGTFNGLARFDGVQFKVFSISNTTQMHNNGIESLCTDGAGRLWIGDNRGGLTLMTDGRFEAIELPREWSAKPVLRMVAAGDGTVWAMNEEGWLLALKDGIAPRIIKLRANPSLFTVDREGRAWIATRGQLCRLDPTDGVIPLPDGPRLDGRWQAVFAAREGGVWVLCDGWLRRWKDDRWVEDRGRADWGTIVLASFVESHSGQILGGSFKEGVSILNPDGAMEHLNESNGLASNWAYCLFEDGEHNVWVGTGNGGLHSLSRRRVTMVDTPDHWRSSAVLSVTPAAAGGLWVGTEGGGIYHLQDGRITNLRHSDAIWQSVANSVMEDRHGRLWVGTWNSGLGYFENSEFRPAWPAERGREVVLTVFESRRGDIWAGTRAGPGRLRGGRWEWFEEVPELEGAVVRCFAEQEDGTIWCGLDGGGLCRIGRDGVKLLGKKDGLIDDHVRALYADAGGAVWIGTRTGLARLRDGQFATLTTRHGLPSNAICQILDDGEGYLWVGSFGGIFRVAKAELNRCADGQSTWVKSVVCDQSSGLATLEMSEQGQPAGCRTSDGRLWFATGKGLAMIRPTEVRENPQPPPLLIEEVLLDGRRLARTGSEPELAIGPGGGRLEFRYTGISLTNPARVGFRYRLKGIDADWVDADAQRAVSYPHLPPGNYLFEVRARNADGIWNPAAASLSVRVLPHFWQTWWFWSVFWLATVAGVGGVVLVVVRRRAQRRVEASERQHALEQERGRIARDIHDDLGGSLTRIVMLSESAGELGDEPGQTHVHLGEISQTARDLTLRMSEIVWAVNPEHDTLDSLANFVGKFAHDFLAGTGIRCRLEIPLALPPLVLAAPLRHGLFLAIKEGLNNVVKHSGATAVRVSLALDPGWIRFTLEDDGTGFEPDAARKSGGNGLRNLQHRLATLGGRCEMNSAAGRGTRLCLVVPRPLHHEATP